MKALCMLFATACLLVAATAQTTSTGTSASGNASVAPGQATAGANASQSVQTPGTSASANASAETSAEAKPKHDHDAKSGDKPSDAGKSSSSSSRSSPSGSSVTLNSGTTLQAELTKSLDAKKCKPGDEVAARLTQDVKADGKVVARKGSRVVGHVSEVQARTKAQADSKLGIVFDKMVLSGGQELAFSGVVKAIAPPLQTALAATADESTILSGPPPGGSAPAPRSGGGMVGGVTSTATTAVSGTTGAVGGTATGAVGGVTNTAGGLTAQGALTGASHGVIGLQGLALNSAASGSAQGSVISSSTRNVRLDSGTQLLLQVTSPAQ